MRGLELVLYAREDLADPLGPAFQLNLNTGPRMSQHVAYDPSEDPRFWFVLDVAIGREAGRALAGPPPAEVFPELPAPLVLGSLQQALGWFAANDARAARRRWRRHGPGRGLRRAAGSRRAGGGVADVPRSARTRSGPATASADGAQRPPPADRPTFAGAELRGTAGHDAIALRGLR